MAMRVRIFNGTPRKNGNTAALTRRIAEEFGDRADVKEFFLYDMNIKGCRNCGICQGPKGDGTCSIKDDMTALYHEFLAADVVIIASPIYMWNFTACTKAFLDRLHCLFRDDGSLNLMLGKRIAVATTMGDDIYVAASAVNAVEFFCQYFECKYCGAIAIPYASKEQIARPLYRETIKDFVTSLENR
jgi:multimeric flavodoxin WrbA